MNNEIRIHRLSYSKIILGCDLHSYMFGNRNTFVQLSKKRNSSELCQVDDHISVANYGRRRCLHSALPVRSSSSFSFSKAHRTLPECRCSAYPPPVAA